MTDRLLKTRDVAEMFSVTPETIRDWIEQKKLRAVKIGNGHYWRVPESAARELAQQMYGDKK